MRRAILVTNVKEDIIVLVCALVLVKDDSRSVNVDLEVMTGYSMSIIDMGRQSSASAGR